MHDHSLCSPWSKREIKKSRKWIRVLVWVKADLEAGEEQGNPFAFPGSCNWSRSVVKGVDSRGSRLWIRIPALPLMIRVASGKFFTSLMLRFFSKMRTLLASREAFVSKSQMLLFPLYQRSRTLGKTPILKHLVKLTTKPLNSELEKKGDRKRCLLVTSTGQTETFLKEHFKRSFPFNI